MGNKRTDAQRKYDTTNCQRYQLKLNISTDTDIITWLSYTDNKQGTIKKAIRAYIKTTSAPDTTQ